MKRQKLLLFGIVAVLFVIVVILYKNSTSGNSSTSEQNPSYKQLALTTNDRLKNITMTVPGTYVQTTLENGQAEVENDGVKLSVKILDNYKEIEDSTGKYVLSAIVVNLAPDVSALYLVLFQDQNGEYISVSDTLVGDITEIKDLVIESTGSEVEHLVILTYVTKAVEGAPSEELSQKFMIADNKIAPIQ